MKDLFQKDGEAEMNTSDILSALCAQNNTLLQAFNPEVIAFRVGDATKTKN